MSKNKVKIEKIEELPNESDSELELNVKSIKKQLDNQVIKPIKPKKQYNLTDEQRQIKSDNMKLIHAKKMECVRVRNEEKLKLAEQEEEELLNKVQKKIIQEKKQREKLIYNKLIQEQEKEKVKSKVKPKKYIEPYSDSDETDEEPIPKPKPKRRPKIKEEVYIEPEQYELPPQEQPRYYRPQITFH